MRNTDLKEIPVRRLNGDEAFIFHGLSKNFLVKDFWGWSASNLLDNTARGILAEFLVSNAVGSANGTRSEWDSFDVKTKDGIRIEVKCSSYIQRWEQSDFSTIQFDIAPKKGWDSSSGKYTFIGRHSDVFVFCILSCKDQDQINPLDLSQWEFMVLSTKKINENKPKQKKISLKPLQRLNPRCVSYENLAAAIHSEFESNG